MADSSEPAFLFLYRKEAVAPVDYLSTFATAPFLFLSYGNFKTRSNFFFCILIYMVTVW